jgi:hypothetical protein
MPAFEMTPEEVGQYGANLTIWEKIALVQAWSPILTYAQRYLATSDPFSRAVIVGECGEWLASKTDSGLDDELVRHIADVLKTPQGEKLVRWFAAKIEGMRS